MAKQCLVRLTHAICALVLDILIAMTLGVPPIDAKGDEAATTSRTKQLLKADLGVLSLQNRWQTIKAKVLDLPM